MLTIILTTITLACLAYSVLTYIKNRNFEESTEMKASAMLEKWKIKEEKRIREDAYKRSREVGYGKTIENIIPIIKDFPVPPRDIQFYGNPIDFIGIKDRGKKGKCEIHFIEVKSGSSNLNGHQKNIKDAIRDGRVFFDEVRIDGLEPQEKLLSLDQTKMGDEKPKENRGRKPKKQLLNG
jgi:predicted Holliday junction resolvase-like endonuclease